MSACTFLIRVEDDNIEALQQAMATVDVKLDPVTDMMAVPIENVLDGIFSGADYDALNAGTAEYFEAQNYPYRLVDDFTSLSHQARMAVLHCFTSNAHWTSDYEPTLQDLEIRHADELREKYPEAFQPA